MAETYQRIRLNLRSPWNYEGETEHEWSAFFNLSGPTPLNPAEAELTAIDLFEPIKLLCASGSHLSGFSYYPQGSKVASTGNTYAAGVHPTTGLGFMDPQQLQQIEVCLLCECPVGLNSRGKRVYLRKWIHAVTNATSDRNTHPTLAAGDALAKWKNGSGPSNLVPVDPTGGAQGGPWTIKPHLFTHQLRRGPKRKVVTKTEYVPVPIP